GGNSFERLPAPHGDHHGLWIDPQNPQRMINGNDGGATITVDGGSTIYEIPTPHGDNHALWIDTCNPQRMIEGNDGGACVSFNGGGSWSTLYNQPTAQFYHVITDNQIPYKIYGSQQDNTAMALPSLSTRGVITECDWFEPGGGESGYIAIKPDDPNIIVAGAIGSGHGNGRLVHYNHRTGQERNITPWPEVTGMGVGAKELKYRFQWTFPILFSRYDADALYITGNHVFRSTNQGHSWEVVSPDLTRNDPAKLEVSGGPISNDNTGAEVYCTIFAFAESPHERGVMWAGSDDGLIHLTRDGGQTWQNVTPRDLPELALISIIEPSPHDPATAYLAATRYKHDDTQPYLFKTNDYGQTWRQITNGIPANDFTRVIREDPARRGLLFAGTETGVYVSFDDGENWQRAQTNLPVVPIHDLHIKDGDLIAATHGRSFWVLDDLSPLRQMSDAAASQPAHLFQPRPTTRYKIYKGYGMKPWTEVSYRMAGPIVYAYRQKDKPTGEKQEIPLDAGQNPPDGVVVAYTLKDKPEADIELSFLDARGNLIKTFSSKEPEKPDPASGKPVEKKDEPRLPKEAGGNRFVWNMRYPDATKLPANKGRAGTDELVVGPVAPPGAYQVQLKVGGQTLTQAFEICKDARVAATLEELSALFEFLMQVRDKLSATHQAIIQIRDLRDQVDGWAGRVGAQANADALKGAAKALREKLTGIEEELVQVKSDDPRSFPSKLNSRLAALTSFVDSADYPPTRQAREVFDGLSARIDEQLARLQALVRTDVAAFNQMMRDAGVDALVPKAAM
ncbi:MAG: glycosyl hydrolase, partial [Chloroflexi bacterium]|nr:glycosyl hydrolase [Chloroflexota bacterium]